MPHEVGFTKRAQKDFNALPQHVQRQIRTKLRMLGEPYDAPNVKAMQGEWTGYYRMRSGDYRIVFDVNDDTKRVTITRIFDRKDAPY